MNSNIIKRKSKTLKKKAFTLVELIIVLAVMAIIAAVAIPNFAAVSQNSKNKADVQSAKTIERAVLMLVADESIQKSNTYTAKFNENKVLEVAGGLTDDQDTIEEALKDVKAPQGEKFKYDENGKVDHTPGSIAEEYQITISGKGEVIVVTDFTPATPPSGS